MGFQFRIICDFARETNVMMSGCGADIWFMYIWVGRVDYDFPQIVWLFFEELVTPQSVFLSALPGPYDG